MEQTQSKQGATRQPSETLDELMDRASHALVETRYFEAERQCVEAFRMARRTGDFERAGRIVLPLLEARRQKRQLAVDAARERGVVLVHRVDSLAGSIEPGCYLICPPAIGLEARMLRERADSQQVPTFVLAREPITRTGLIPIVGVGRISVRARILPIRVDPATGEGIDLSSADAESDQMLRWFEHAGEALGDAGIATVDVQEHPAWRADDLIDRLEAVPDHEKLHQRLAEACRAAATVPEPPHERRRPIVDDPFSF